MERRPLRLEYKSPGVPLKAAYNKLLQYAAALNNPPLLITSDINQIVIRTNWTNFKTETYTIPLSEMDLIRWQRILRHVFTDPEQLKPKTTRQQLTTEVASDFSELIRTLKKAGHDLKDAAHFVNRLVFCLFANSSGLLPSGLMAEMVEAARREPAMFRTFCEALFRAMAFPGGMVGFKQVPWFNGTLFEDAKALPLNAIQLNTLRRALEERDWSQVDVAILGTLFERGLEADERARLGAHYTDRAKIMLIVEPVVVRPLLEEWAAALARMGAATAALPPPLPQEPAGVAARRAAARAAAGEELAGFQARLRAFRILDPACGSGNFLYVALGALLDVEHRAILEAEQFSGERAVPGVGPEAVMGIELNPYAAELARVSVWIGYLQWLQEHGYALPKDPMLKALDQIECRNALLDDQGRALEWPVADVAVGNPPFLGGKLLRRRLGNAMVEATFAAFKGRVPPEADLVCYWFEQAREAQRLGRLGPAGFVATNSIRGGVNRHVLGRISEQGSVFEAWSDEPWVLDGAAVRVSLVCFGGAGVPARLDGAGVPSIHADLTAAASDLTAGRRLRENAGISFMGVTPAGPFDVEGEQARRWLLSPANANGLGNAGVLRPYWNGRDLTQRPADRWIIDFGTSMTLEDAAYFSAPYAHLVANVQPLRAMNARELYR